MPLLELDRTALICISTILDPCNYYSKLLELKDENGDSFFQVHRFTMACDACIEAGTPEQCTHMFRELPPWQSARKHRKIRAMMADEPELLMRETQGISSDLHQRAFPQKFVRQWTMRAPFDHGARDAVRHVVLAIDPSGGGSSHFAVVSCFYHLGTMAVCGLESVCAKSPDQYAAVLLQHCKLLRRAFPRALFVVAPEANLGTFTSCSPSPRMLAIHACAVLRFRIVAHRPHPAARRVHDDALRSTERRAGHAHDAPEQGGHAQPAAGTAARRVVGVRQDVRDDRRRRKAAEAAEHAGDELLRHRGPAAPHGPAVQVGQEDVQPVQILQGNAAHCTASRLMLAHCSALTRQVASTTATTTWR